MAFPLISKSKKGVLERCLGDYATKMRHKYAPYYLAMDGQDGTSVELDGRRLIMLASNDYLGLAFHPKVIEAAREALHKWGASTNGARSSNGTRSFHLELEARLAAFLGRQP